AEAGLTTRSKEMFVSLVSSTPGNLEELGFPGGSLVLDSRFDKMAEDVAVMRAVQEGRIPRSFPIVRHINVKVPVSLLTQREQIDDLVHSSFQDRVTAYGQRISHRFQELVQVGFFSSSVQFALDMLAGSLAQRSL